MTEQQAMRMALEALEINLVFLRNVKPFKGQEDLASDCVAMTDETITALRRALEQQPADEPVAFPQPKFEKVAEGIEVGYDMLGGVDIRLGGEFVYVHINYDYRYTDNAGRRRLAEQVVGLLTRPQPAAWVGMTDEELKPLCDVNHIIFGAYTIDFVRAIEAKLKEKNT